MLWKINFSNGLYVETPDQMNTQYQAYIGPGNNYYLVKGVLKRRFWWNVVDRPENSNSWKDTQFVWTQLKQNTFFKIQNNSAKKRPRALCESQKIDETSDRIEERLSEKEEEEKEF